MMLIRSRVVCAGLILVALPPPLIAASFLCSKAKTVVETLICGDSELSEMDDNLAALYRLAKASAPDKAIFKKETNEEWKRRESCRERDCLAQWYQHRSTQLATILHHSPEKPIPAADVAMAPLVAPRTTVAVAASDSSTGILGYLALIGAMLIVPHWLLKKIRGDTPRQAAKSAEAINTLAAVGAPRAELERSDAGIRSRQTRSTQKSADLIRPAVPGNPTSRESCVKQSAEMPLTVWISPGQPVTVKGVRLPGGMLYIGSALKAPDGSIEPAQIDPTLDVDPTPADPAERSFGYWPRYHDISPTARRAYLTWLAGGRTDPAANIGYVFLFFYGLERRLLVDAAKESGARAEIPAIIAEIERLRSIYDNGSFLQYSGGLLDFIAAGDVKAGHFQGPPPPSTVNRGMSMRLRIGLGQAAVEGKLVSADWALAWARSEPNVRLSSVAKRCARQFDEQFVRCYAEKCGAGLKLSVNRTKLKVSYRPASAGLLHQSFVSSLGDLPDVTTVVTPLKKLQAVVDEASETLESYSRLIGKHPEKAASLEANLLLPKQLWTSSVASAFAALEQRVSSGMVVIKLSELVDALGGTSSLTRGTLKSLLTVLENEKLGVEPDVLAGARAPKPEDSIVLFRLQHEEALSVAGKQGSYDAVAVMLDLAITLANADGKISGREVQFLNRQVDAWSHVGAAAQRRLRARLRLGILYPPTLTSLKSRIETLPLSARQGLAKLLSALALADGKLEPAAVKHLEKVYQVLGIDSASLYSELHVVSAAADMQSPKSTEKVAPIAALDKKGSKIAPPITRPATSGLLLDASRISALQAESERVTALLAKVFEEKETEKPVAAELPSAKDEDHAEKGESRLLGLDAEHTVFLRALLTRAQWSRAELLDMAADMELMLDGALERVNEAALDRFDASIAEGEDPVEIAQDLMESVST